MIRIFSRLALVVLSLSFASSGELDKAIENVFGSENRSNDEKPCQGGTGVCVPYYLCLNGTINTDGSDLLDIRFNEEEECADYFEQCCSTNEVLPQPVTPAPRPIPPDQGGFNPPPNQGGTGPQIPPNQGGGTGPQIPPNQGGYHPPPNPNQGGTTGPQVPPNQGGTGPHVPPNQGTIDGQVPPPLAPKCGYRNSEGVGFRITGNTQGESEYGEFPWMLAILKQEVASDQVLNIYQCGGSLIHPQVVLTAAHCVQGKDAATLKIRAGEWDTQTTNEIFPYSDHEVQDVVIYKDFYKAALHNDVALLFLKTPVKYDQHIATICLPPQDATFDHSRCFASGWGKDTFGKEGKYQVILKKIELPVVPFLPCQEKLRTTRLGKRYALHNSFMCAGGEPGKDTCKGDGGSPLVCPVPGKPGHYYQAGITAWGIGCGEVGIPGVYVNVAKFRNWIDQQVAGRGLQSQSYII